MLWSDSLVSLFKRKVRAAAVDEPSTNESPSAGSTAGSIGTKQSYEAFLVFDVEGTCMAGTNFSYPNEIIEWPVCLMRWRDKNPDTGHASDLQVVDEFRQFVRPTWRPRLSRFCTELTGITQSQVDEADTFPHVMDSFRDFLVRNGLINPDTNARTARFAFATDGPWDLKNFFVKQCFISKMDLPEWMPLDFIDVRMLATEFASHGAPDGSKPRLPKILRGFGITLQLHILGLPPFQGRQHSGIDDARNIARILAELARRGFRLLPNSSIDPKRRWAWMGKKGRILEEYV